MQFPTALLTLVAGLAAASPANEKRQFGVNHTGDMTYYAPGLGACSWTNGEGEYVAAINAALYNQYTTGTDPKNNSLCGHTARIYLDGKSVDIKIVDKLPSGAEDDIDVTQVAFAAIADVSRGRVQVTWEIL